MKTIFAGEAAHRQHLFANGVIKLGKELGQFAPYHLGDQRLTSKLRGVVAADPAAVTEDTDLIGNGENLVHFMTDIDDGFALRAQVTNDGEKMRHFAFGQRGSRLIHNHDIGVPGDRFGDLHHLLRGDA